LGITKEEIADIYEVLILFYKMANSKNHKTNSPLPINASLSEIPPSL
jgi:hypothetical protein